MLVGRRFLMAAIATLLWAGSATVWAAPSYVSIGEPLVLNLQSPGRPYFMQMDASVLAADSGAAERVKQHLAALRHELIMIYAERPVAEVRDLAQRQVLQDEAVARLQGVLESLSGEGGVQGLVFGSFLVQ